MIALGILVAAVVGGPLLLWGLDRLAESPFARARRRAGARPRGAGGAADGGGDAGWADGGCDAGGDGGSCD